MRFRKYKCHQGICTFDWPSGNRKSKCTSCGLTMEEIDTVWDNIRSLYYECVPFAWRPKNFWYKFKCWAWYRYTTVKPRNLDHTWCDRVYLLPTMIFEIACQFIEKEGPKTQEEWDWQKEHNPAFYASWIETKEICDWWTTKYRVDYPYDLSETEIKRLVKETGKSLLEISDEQEKKFLVNAKRLIDLSPWYWT